MYSRVTVRLFRRKLFRNTWGERYLSVGEVWQANQVTKPWSLRIYVLHGPGWACPADGRRPSPVGAHGHACRIIDVASALIHLVGYLRHLTKITYYIPTVAR